MIAREVILKALVNLSIKILVVISGFPPYKSLREVKQRISEMCGNNQIVKVFRKYSKFYFCIKFKSQQNAVLFADQEHFLGGKQLLCKVVLSQDQFIEEQFSLFLDPKRIFVSMIPKTTTKNQVRKKLVEFGPIVDLQLNINENSSFNFCFINYIDYESTRKAVDTKTLTIAKGKDVKIIFSKPMVHIKFSELVKHPLDSMINDIVMDNVPFDYDEFLNVYKVLYESTGEPNNDEEIFLKDEPVDQNNNAQDNVVKKGKRFTLFIDDEIIDDLEEYPYDNIY